MTEHEQPRERPDDNTDLPRKDPKPSEPEPRRAPHEGFDPEPERITRSSADEENPDRDPAEEHPDDGIVDENRHPLPGVEQGQYRRPPQTPRI